jgi:L-lactate dehydrogenase
MKITVSVIGFGNIGKFLSGLLLAKTEHQIHLNILDTDWHVFGAILDFEHAMELYPNHSISYNNEELLNSSNFIFHCAGASVPRGKSRLITCQKSVEITEAIFKNFRPQTEPFIIVVANPVEIITHITQKVTGLPKHKVLGTGTFLDSIRMNYIIKKTNDNVKVVDAVLLGEHGTTAFLSHQYSTVNGQPIDHFFDANSIDELMNTVKASAEEIKETQKATIYGVSYCAMQIFDALLSNEVRKIPVSTFIPSYLSNELEDTDISLSLYSDVSKEGVRVVKEYNPNEDELDYLKKSIQLIKPFIPSEYQ